MTEGRPHPPHLSPDAESARATVLEVFEERIAVDRRRIAGETVLVATTTRLRETLVEEPLDRETIEIERVAVGRVVDAAPDIRQEGDVTIVPVMEEVLVVERRLILKEEVRIRRIRTTAMHRETVQLREQSAEVTRHAAGDTTRTTPHAPQSSTQGHIS